MESLMKLVRTPLVILAGLSLYSISAQAQSGFLTRPAIGIFGGLTIPRGDFKLETDVGGHAGALASIRLYQQFDARIDGAWNKFPGKTIESQNATVKTDVTLIDVTLNGVLNLGPDSSSYPGDNSVSPYLMVGGGAYNLEYDATCTGQCELFTPPEKKTNAGFTIGFGTNATFGVFHPMIEGRYHRIFRSDDVGGSRTMFTFSAGIRFR
jgi:hypothetical protein